MRSIRCFVALTVLLGLSAFASPLSAAEFAGLSVSVSISPAPNRPDDCLCKAEITDLADGKLIAAPNVIVSKGESGKVSVGDHASYSLVFDLTIAKTGTSATYSVTYSKKETVVAVQKGAISIR